MGMFDKIIVDLALPDMGVSLDEFQTKDLACDLNTYRIFPDKSLRLICRIEAPDQPIHELVDYTGEIVFYGCDDQEQRWREYIVLVANGTVIHGPSSRLSSVPILQGHIDHDSRSS